MLSDASQCCLTLTKHDQGAAQGIEDAAVLSTLLSHSTDLPNVVDVYQHLRKPRAERVHKIARNYRVTFTLGPGKEKNRRDKLMAQLSQASGDPDKPRKLAAEHWLDQYDAVADVRKLNHWLVQR